MGTLEDAIREHLELKRRTGADPEDVARQEREALSPPTREEAPAEPVSAEVSSAQIERTLAASPFDDSQTANAPDPEAPTDFDLGTIEHEVVELEPEPSAVFVEADEIFAAEPDLPEPSQKEADVLEQTPEFLAETPDHDRLWFEQKPPKDFNF
ncbi:MAG: hypothetical protein NTV40_10425 [Solirubrobacterales bacterium]|nr:hypothetical protein [Solirubrobacterales bacterium]